MLTQNFSGARNLEAERRLQNQCRSVWPSRRTTWMKDVLHARLNGPPRSDLDFVAQLDDTFVVHRRKTTGRKRVDVLLGAADVIAKLQIGNGQGERVPITRGYQPTIDEAAIQFELGETTIRGRAHGSNKSD